tara:strand:+ start:16317 stop:18509 length:2193 start_codon:yes stop_codon:yes gene_type:complete
MPIATPQGTLDFKSVDKVTFVGASSNTVIDTTTGSLGVGVGVGGPTSNLHVVGNTRLEGDINMLHTANTASIKLNSNVVAEFPRSKKLIKYPRVALTANSSGGYVSSASTVLNSTLEAWYVFDTVNPEGSSVSRWRSANNVYTNNSAGSPAIVGTAAQLSASSGTPSGEYILVTLPEKMCLKRYSWSGLTTQGPKDGEIWGSNDGSSWSHVHTFTDGNSGWVSAGSSPSDYGNYPDHRDVGEGNVAFYSRYAFIITKLVDGDVAASMRDLQYFGTPEYDPEAHGTDVTVKSYPNVPNTDWLEVYYDAKGETTMPNPVTDLVGGDQDASVYGVTLDTTNEAFVFNGSSYLETDIPQITTGVWPFTMSFWFKVNAHIGGTWNYLAHLGVRSGNSGDSTLIGLKDDLIAITTWGDSKINSGVVATPGVWYHVTSTWPGGPFYDNAKLYINAVSYGDVDNTRDETSPLSFPTSGNKLTLGKQMNTTSDYFDGSIANFRLFNRALTSDEIYQLYAYQKEYFGHGDLGMTLKAGRLGIGTSEPRAALDVRGRIIREYNPGEIIETIQGKANGRYVKVQSGAYLLPNVGTHQDLTSTHTRINGSNFDYTPPPGTTRVIYEFWCFMRQGDPRPIIHFQGRVGGTIVNDSRHTYRDNTDTGLHDPQFWTYSHMCISIGEVTSDNIAGGQVATWVGPRTIDFTAREYNDSYEARLHNTNHWDGGGSDILVRPTIKITAIA